MTDICLKQKVIGTSQFIAKKTTPNLEIESAMLSRQKAMGTSQPKTSQIVNGLPHIWPRSAAIRSQIHLVKRNMKRVIYILKRKDSI